MTLLKNILFVIFAIGASVAIFNYAGNAEAEVNGRPANVKCYSGGTYVFRGDVLDLKVNNGQYSFFEPRGNNKMRVPVAMCIVKYNRAS